MIALAAAAIASSLAVGPPAMTLSTDGGAVTVSLRAEETEAKFRIRYGGCSCVSREPGDNTPANAAVLLVAAGAIGTWKRKRNASRR